MGVGQTLRRARESGTKTMGMGHQRIQGMACMVARSQLTLVSHSLTTATARIMVPVRLTTAWNIKNTSSSINNDLVTCMSSDFRQE